MMQFQRRPMVNQIRRDAWVEVNLGSIESNIKEIKKLVKPNVKILAVVKADCYGHGSVMSASTLLASGVSMLGVASVDEGLQLRRGGITAPILVLGDTPEWAIESAVQNDISISIFTQEHIRVCQYIYEKSNISPKVHIKINTGMNRIGVKFKNAKSFIRQALNEKAIKVKGIFTHLACAEDEEKTQSQIAKWQEIYNEFKSKDILFHAANTAAVFTYPELQYDMVRVGIGISGLMPDVIEGSELPKLKQVMSLKARIVYVSELEEGEGVSYGYSFVSDKKRKIAVIPVGYADGVSRALSNKIYGIVNGVKVPQIGNITMDQTMIDITDVPNVQKGDIVTLLGHDGNEFISIDDWANILNTINYEISCSLKVRLPRIYTR
jgi:alanine racemase